MAKSLARHESPGVSTIHLGQIPIVWVRARGANVQDADGNIYIDMTGGFGVANLGHRHGRVVAAVQRQSAKLLHGLGDVYPNDARVALVERLAKLAPIRNAKVMLCTTGSEAVELALKTAALATKRTGILAFEGAFHGQSYGALAVTSRSYFRAPFEAQIFQGVVRAPFPNPYRSPLTAAGCLEHVEKLLASPPAHVGPIGAVIVEPIQGREGEIVPPKGFLSGLRSLCDRSGALLIADEMITGFGRTGAWFAVQHEKVEPDIICLGKALAGGLPVAACIGKAKVMDAWRASGPESLHASTFLGNPVGAAAALASITELERRKAPQQAKAMGDWLMKESEALKERHPIIGDVRGKGLMLGVELVKDRATKEPAPEAATKAMEALLRRGVLVLAGGVHGNVLSLTPPLTISRAQAAYAVRAMGETLD
jgi:4-aminobutyrate aminotransferase